MPRWPWLARLTRIVLRRRTDAAIRGSDRPTRSSVQIQRRGRPSRSCIASTAGGPPGSPRGPQTRIGPGVGQQAGVARRRSQPGAAVGLPNSIGRPPSRGSRRVGRLKSAFWSAVQNGARRVVTIPRGLASRGGWSRSRAAWPRAEGGHDPARPGLARRVVTIPREMALAGRRHFWIERSARCQDRQIACETRVARVRAELLRDPYRDAAASGAATLRCACLDADRSSHGPWPGARRPSRSGS